MLDVHPPHSPTHTWKDFFIHIATIGEGTLVNVMEPVSLRHQANRLYSGRVG